MRFHLAGDPTLLIAGVRSVLEAVGDLRMICATLGDAAPGSDRQDELSAAATAICAISADAVRQLESDLRREPDADQAVPVQARKRARLVAAE